MAPFIYSAAAAATSCPTPLLVALISGLPGCSGMRLLQRLLMQGY